ncbi:MAG: aldose 1-epimerase family protein [Clostridia bacterium]|nr:aldose 1-epimerase family protein [Clostridia bacterium]
MVVLKNGFLECKISEMGAELKSAVKDGVEYIWQADPKFWAQSAPIMFPICGGLKNGRYELDGESYTMSKHGFAKLSEFTVESADGNSAVFVLRDSEETRKIYPYSFEFRVTFKLSGSSLAVTYSAVNLDTKTMYCSFGAHEAYATPEGIEDYDVIFPEKETLYAYALNGDLLTDYTKLIVEDSNVLPLKDEYFYLDALVFRGVKSRYATLRNRVNGRSVRVDFPGFDYFLLWHKYTAPYICVEPWCGVQDVAGSSYDIALKEGINAIPVGERLERTHTVTFG